MNPIGLDRGMLEQIEELSYIPPQREQLTQERIKKQIRAAFAPFEREGSDTCDIRDVGTVVRALGLNPTEAQLHQMIEEIEEDEPTGFVRFERFEALMKRVLTRGEFNSKVIARDAEETILAAFEVLDPEKKGYIDADFMRELLLTKGERFTNDEVLEFINAAADPETGQIKYEDYAAILAVD
eukprot:TRINITY_DN68159_c8_g4_i1.p1 TRINITY_DN68159_c8_g4~~TRINITY_DN68159_c8_g4_i1.p1  ORF type:complete len:183 (+),score=38.98 TRINITY_DN68159_c8_g4_i1:112-660(+)